MRIQIIGLGIVGTAQAYLSKKLGYWIVGYDPKFKSHPYCRVNNRIIKDVDITFICTPESVVENIIDSLIRIGHKGLIVIKSTISVGTTDYLSEKFNIHICHNPEFLRERHSLEDVMNPDMIIIGECCQKHGNLLENFYRPMNKHIIRTDITKSELIKLTTNAYLSTLITFWNEIDQLCNKLDIDTKDISDIIRHDPRISSYGCNFFGKPYGGKCLIKDMEHLINNFHSLGLNPKLFEACDTFNNELMNKYEKKNKDMKRKTKI